MIWSSTASVERLLVRRIREELVDINTQLGDIEQQLQTARNVVIPIVQEVHAARGTSDTVGDRLDIIESRLDALETPPTP